MQQRDYYDLWSHLIVLTNTDNAAGMRGKAAGDTKCWHDDATMIFRYDFSFDLTTK